jgi:hypothetical protein
MKPNWEVEFGPNSDGWSIILCSAPKSKEDYDYLAKLIGPSCQITAGTYDSRNYLDQFASELKVVFNALSGNAELVTDYFEMKVTVLETGHMRFAATFSVHEFEQYPTGSIRIYFDQSFDPITIEQAIQKL